ncbi:MAG TPA: ABC transporter permease [Anaerolineae bacterium]|nr:ABC transporter permease [Anaerolineae bacterium]
MSALATLTPLQKTMRALRNIPRGIWRFLKLMSRNKTGFLGFLIFIGFVLLTTVGPLLVPEAKSADILAIYAPPCTFKEWRVFARDAWFKGIEVSAIEESGAPICTKHLLGTDSQGKDIFAQIVHGGRDILQMALLTGLISTFVGITLGALSAVIGGRFDAFLTILADIWLTIPRFPLLAVLATLVKLDNMLMLALLLSFLSWAGLYLSIRAQVFSLKERDYVEAAVALDLGLWHIIFSEILPNMMSYIAISFTFGMTSAIYAQVGLVFLGLVPLTRNWGVMINLAWTQGAIFFKDSVYFIMAPVMSIALFQLSIVWMSRSLEEIFNPRLRTG